MDLLKHKNIMVFLDLFMTLFKNISPKEVELKLEPQRKHYTFYDLDIKIEDSSRKDANPILYDVNASYAKQYTITNFLWVYIFRTSSYSKMHSRT